MNLLPGRAQRYHFFEEGNEVEAGVAGRGSSVHAAGLGVQRGIQRKRSMPVILEAVTLGSSRRKRQNGIEPIQGLDGGFLIDAEHRGMPRRLQIQADKVGRFAFELCVHLWSGIGDRQAVMRWILQIPRQRRKVDQCQNK